jgi:2-polyprenyl-3-methyl-5-hydroxy-6-metoxy-1,4-benzoquinol methylase
MARDVPFEPIVSALRDEIVDHFAERGQDIDDETGRKTLDTNSTLAAQRADMLVATYLARSGHSDLEGLRIADLGCGFGSLSLALAARRARVVGIDPNVERMQVAARLASRFGLDAGFHAGTLQRPAVDAASFDLAIVNNALCYIVDKKARGVALASVSKVLVDGGWLVLRDPNRSHPRDVFTGLPLVHRLPPTAAAGLLGAAGVHRSRVRVTTPRAVRRELRRAGFVNVRFDGSGDRRRLVDRFAGHHHTSGQKPR